MSFKTYIKQKWKEKKELDDKVAFAVKDEKEKQMIQTALYKEKIKGERQRQEIKKTTSSSGSGINFQQGFEALMGKPNKKGGKHEKIQKIW